MSDTEIYGTVPAALALNYAATSAAFDRTCVDGCTDARDDCPSRRVLGELFTSTAGYLWRVYVDDPRGSWMRLPLCSWTGVSCGADPMIP